MHRCAWVRGALADVRRLFASCVCPFPRQCTPGPDPLRDPGRAHIVREEARAHGLQKAFVCSQAEGDRGPSMAEGIAGDADRDGPMMAEGITGGSFF